jgi:hypothetical protein
VPTAASLNALSLANVDAVGFDRNLPGGACNAYVANYGPTGASHGVVTTVNPQGIQTTRPLNDPTHPRSIAVERSGQFAFTMGLEPSETFMRLETIEGALANQGPFHDILTFDPLLMTAVPFNDSWLDTGLVGPVFDQSTFAATGAINLYVANRVVAGDLYLLRHTGPYAYQQIALPIAAPSLVTALALADWGPFEIPPVSRDPVLVGAYYVAAGNTTLLFYHLSNGTYSTSQPLQASFPDIVSVQGLSADPMYGDIYIEAGTTSGQVRLLMLHASDQSLRSLRDVQTDLLHSPSAPALLLYQGGLSAESGGRLVGFEGIGPHAGLASWWDTQLCP